MQGALDAGAVVGVEFADALDHVVQLLAGDFGFAQGDLVFHEAGGGNASQVEDDLEQFVAVVCFFHRMADIEREDIEKCVEIVVIF